MSDQIKPHDLVLRDGKVEEVLNVGTRHGSTVMYFPVGGSHWPNAEDATRIGSTLPPENWRVHTGSERPEGVGAGDVVEVAFASASNQTHRAGFYGWHPPSRPGSIVAYRIVSRATPPISGQGENCGQPAAPSQTDMHNQCLEALRAAQATMASERAGLKIVDDVLTAHGCQLVNHASRPRQVPASELRAVAEKFRQIADKTDACSRSRQRITDSTEFRAWADRLDPPQPEPDPRIAVVQSFTACTDDYAKRILVALDAAK